MIIRSTIRLKKWPILPVLRNFRLEKLIGLKSQKNRNEFKQTTFNPDYCKLYELMVFNEKVNERNHLLYLTMLVEHRFEK